jgi:nucleotide-binding universal stress UspA family protein
MTTRQLVFGDDGSAPADRVWEWIAAHRWAGWTISVVTAVEPDAWPALPPEHVPLVPWEPLQPRRLASPAPDTVVEHLRGDGDPRAVLDSCAGASLMAIGPRGAGLLKQLHLGSTAEWLLQSPSPPIVVVRTPGPTRNVLLCTDGADDARDATALLADLPWIGGCRVVVLAVDDGRTDVGRATRDAAATLRAVGLDPTLTTPRAERRLAGVRDDVRSVIFDAIHEHDVDLVVLGTGGSDGLRHAVLGSTASAVALHAPCSVLVATAHRAPGATPVAPTSP